MANDPYMNHRAVCGRIYQEWKKYGSLIIAVDYDDTLYDFHKKGYHYDQVIELLRRAKKLGAKIIIFTCCGEDQYDAIKDNLQVYNVPFDTINEDLLPQPFKGRKVYYNVLLDDRAGLESAYKALEEVIYYLEKEQS